MNPFKVSKVIKQYDREGKYLSANDLQRMFGCKISRKYLHLSKGRFTAESGRRHHHITGLKLKGWIMLWFIKPKERSEQHKESTDEEDLQDAVDYSAESQEVKEAE